MTGDPTRWVVLLRGINVGRAKQVDMPRLRAALEARGHTGVRTHLRSGNVLLSSPATEAHLVEDVGAAVRGEFGFDAAVVVRTAAELAAVVAADPLGPVATDPKRHLVTFLPEEPDAEHRAALPPPPGDEGDGSTYVLAGRELHQWLPGGVLGSTLSTWKWDRLLGHPGTARNWSTVTALDRLVRETT